MHPTHQAKTISTVTPNFMKAIIELKGGDPSYSLLIKTLVKNGVWHRCKFPGTNFKTAAGQNVKRYIKIQMQLGDQEFENNWDSGEKKSIMACVNQALWQERAFVVQKMKEDYYSE